MLIIFKLKKCKNKTVKTISSYAFAYCDELKNITFSNNSFLEKINSYAFLNCKKLENIKIPNSVITIGTGAFASCTSFTKIEIPINVTSVGKKVFASIIFLEVYCCVESLPEGWQTTWLDGCFATVYWGYNE